MKDDLLFFFKLFRKGTLLFCCSFLLIVCAAMLEGLSYSFLILAFSSFFNENVMSFLPVGFLEAISKEHLFSLSIACAVATQFLKSGLCLLAVCIQATLGMRLQTTVQLEIYDRIFHLNYRELRQFKIGELVEYVRAPMQFFRPFFEHFGQLFANCCIIVVSLIFMSYLSWPLTCFIVALFSLGVYIQKRVVKKSHTLSQLLTRYLEKFTTTAVQSLSAVKLIHLYDSQSWVKKKMELSLKKFEKASRSLFIANGFVLSLNEILGVFLVSLTLCIGAFILSWEGKTVVPLLLGCMTITYRLSGKVLGAMHSLNQIANLSGSFKQMKSIMTSTITPKSKKPLTFMHELAFDRVTFCYPGKSEPVLENLVTKIKKGEILAVVGSSGVGKSTLIDLLSGLYFPTEGAITVDGTVLNEENVYAWRQKLGIVHQEITLFNETVEQNIRWGNEKSTQAEVVEAAKSALCHEFISKLPLGYQTIVGERGLNLSGGERQRIAIARALLRNPEILLLDEATNQLDTEMEEWIGEFLLKQRGKKTIIVIAHHGSYLKYACKVLRIGNGKKIGQNSLVSVA